jgi:hypothetical protein
MTIYCDVHKQPMERATTMFQSDLVDKYPIEWMKCYAVGCNRHYNPTHGYVDIRDERIVGASRRIEHCPEGHGGMGITGYREEEPTWTCIHQDCRSTPTAARHKD